VAQKLEPVTNFQIKPRRILKGHQGKVLALDWCSDKRHLATTSQVNISQSQSELNKISILFFF
jgi:WD40 repeat protein